MIGESVYNCVGKTLWNVSGEAWRALPEAGMAAAVHVVRSGHDLVRETGHMVSRWRHDVSNHARAEGRCKKH
jgi:hypothetical protein